VSLSVDCALETGRSRTKWTDWPSSLAQDDIPFKLRCAICNKLATNAFRLPCCDQAICESCMLIFSFCCSLFPRFIEKRLTIHSLGQTSLPDSCPVCDHNPVSPDLCKPNKALRTTLKAFLRTEEKKREKDRSSTTPAVTVASAPVASVTAEETTISTNKVSHNATSTEAAQAEPVPVAAVDNLPNDQLEALAEDPAPAQVCHGR
jgi:hypothetical protein